MPRPKKTAERPAPKKRPIEQYDHKGKQRANNPPVGLVTPQSDPDTGLRPKSYACDPHLQWAGKAEHTSFELPTVSLHVHERIDPKTVMEALKRTNGSAGPAQSHIKAAGVGETTGARYDQLESPDGKTRRPMTTEERERPEGIPDGWRPYQLDNLTSGAYRENTTVPLEFAIDVLVDFEPGTQLTLFGLARVENELSDLLDRRVDLHEPGSLHPAIRERVLGSAKDVYVAA